MLGTVFVHASGLDGLGYGSAGLRALGRQGLEHSQVLKSSFGFEVSAYCCFHGRGSRGVGSRVRSFREEGNVFSEKSYASMLKLSLCKFATTSYCRITLVRACLF